MNKTLQFELFPNNLEITCNSIYDEYSWVSNNNFDENAHNHTTCYHELSKDEIWLGNTSGNNKLEKGVDIPTKYAHLKTIRLGKQAYCINGKPLSRDYCLPLIINKSDEIEYEKIYKQQMVMS